MYIVSEGDFYRTRLTHTLEVAQVARSLSRQLCLDEDLAEAIALGHDLGHTPFGHAGEQTLDRLLRTRGVAGGWNSNTHSLFVAEELEFEHPTHPGLDLTYAARQGIARHHTPFDRPDDAFDAYPSPTLEAQVVNLADIIAYAGHDVEDALFAGLLDHDVVRDSGDHDPFAAWSDCLRQAEGEFLAAGYRTSDLGRSGSEEMSRRLYQRARRHFINTMIISAVGETRERVTSLGIADFSNAVDYPQALVECRVEHMRRLHGLVSHMIASVYQSPLVVRQNYKEGYILTRIFEALWEDKAGVMLTPVYRQRVQGKDDLDRAREVARFLASLSDRGVIDLFAELFDPHERTMARGLH